MTVNIALLTGAGVSIPAGLPSTAELTDKILGGVGIEKVLPGESREAREVLLFLQAVYKRVERFFQGREVNYEDIYYVTSQVGDFLKEYENPVVLNFVESLLEELSLFSEEEKKRLNGNMALLAEKAGNYINNTITSHLGLVNLNLDYLNFLKEMISDQQVNFLNIFTLNHDLLLEMFFIKNKIKYHDGFVEDKNKEIRVWSPDFQKKGKKVNLLKLHGSINWYKFKTENRERYQGYYFAAFDPVEFYIKELATFPVLEQEPLILTGRYNKILEYNRSIYVDLHYNFYQLLPLSTILLISGYSFNDKGINSWLIDWLYSAKENHIFLIHPEPENCINKAGWGIREQWPIWIEKRKAFTIPLAIEDFSWKDSAGIILREAFS